jgi:hypothetical protein
VIPQVSPLEQYHPTERQQVFHSIAPYNPKLVKGYFGGLGSGKSTACEHEQAWVCLKTPGGKSAAVRYSMGRSHGTLIEDYQRLLRGVARWVSSRSRFEFDNGHHLYVYPADAWDRFGSFDLVSFYIQEAQEVDYKIFDALNQRLRHPAGIQNGIPWYRGYIDARGVKTDHWLWEKFVKRAWDVDTGLDKRKSVPNVDFVYIKGRTYDNLENLRQGYMEELIRDHKDDIAWQKMMIEGEFGFDIEGRPVYECYRPDVHDATIYEDPTLPILRGWDFGFNRPAVVWCQYTRDGRLLVLRELCPTGVSRDELVALVDGLQKAEFPNRHPSQYRDYGDAAGEQANAASTIDDIEYIENKLHTSIETRKARIKEGLEVVRRLMMQTTKKGEPRFQIDTRCDRLIQGLRGAYYYETEKTNDVPVKGLGYDDVCDALRYVAQLVVEEGFTPDSTFSGKSQSFEYGTW